MFVRKGYGGRERPDDGPGILYSSLGIFPLLTNPFAITVRRLNLTEAGWWEAGVPGPLRPVAISQPVTVVGRFDELSEKVASLLEIAAIDPQAVSTPPDLVSEEIHPGILEALREVV